MRQPELKKLIKAAITKQKETSKLIWDDNPQTKEIAKTAIDTQTALETVLLAINGNALLLKLMARH